MLLGKKIKAGGTAIRRLRNMTLSGILARVAGAVAGALILGQAAALADEQTAARGADLWANKAGCPFCHGWAADGNGDPHSDGGAPSLRAMALDRDQIREVIACGRPGTGMPHYDRFAYTDDRCYGVTAEDLGDQVPNRGAVTLQRPQIDQIADYLAEVIKDRGPVTFEECVAYFGGPSSVCNSYPKAEAAAPAADDRPEHAAAETLRTPGG
jgi:hypothetical protein